MTATVWPAFWYDEIDSTNDAAKRLADKGEFDDCWIAARRQTGGRGRLGRRWVSAGGNLYASSLYHEPGGYAAALRAPFAAALAVHDVLSLYLPDKTVGLKWPNDVRVDGAKIAGILVESGSGEPGLWVVVGIGANIAVSPVGLDQPVTCLAELVDAAPPDAQSVLELLRQAYAVRLQEARSEFSATLSAWLERADGLGAPARVRLEGHVVEGVFEGLADDGAMQLRLPDGQMRLIRAGDIELVKKVDS